MLTTTQNAATLQNTLSERLRLLELASFRILDTETEPVFDDITRLASETFGMPIALITLVDETRQWFKSEIGLGLAQTPREISFCSHAINQPNRVMVVEDAHADPQFRDNPLVNGSPHIRFYAGAPMVSAQGAALGTVCVIDSKPRSFSPKQAAQLQLLSRLAMSQIELRRMTDELLRTGRDLAHANRMMVERMTQGDKTSLMDSATGVFNRRFFDTGLVSELQRVVRFGGDLSVIRLDVDRLKSSGDSTAKQFDDKTLRLLATVLRGLLKMHETLARTGEREFAVILPGASDVNAVILAERIVHRIRLTRFPNGRMTLSGGYSYFDAAYPERDLFQLAGDVLQAAKAQGGDCVGSPPV